MNNEDNSYMKIPYNQCTYFLRLFDGDKVDDWVLKQTNILQEKVNYQSDLIKKMDKILWSDLIDSFTNAFAYTGRVEQARTRQT